MQPSTTISKSQRVFKFRAWNEEKMIYSDVHKFVIRFDGDIGCFNEKIQMYDTVNWYLMQFTGIYDKNDKEIYEGDLMRVLDRDWPSGGGDPQEHMRSIASICEVVYHVDRFSLVKRKHGYSDEDLGQTYGRDLFEVIGNIYENPELLNP